MGVPRRWCYLPIWVWQWLAAMVVAAAVGGGAFLLLTSGDDVPVGADTTTSTAVVTSSTSSTTTLGAADPTAPAVAAVGTGVYEIEQRNYCVVDVDADDILNLRTGPGIEFEDIGDVPYDAVGVRTTGRAASDSNDRTWFEIRYGDSEGWVASWHLTPAPCTATTGAEYCVIDHPWDDALNVRSGAGTSNAVVGTLPFYGYGVLATGMEATDSDGQVWYEIVHGAGTGWVASWFLAPAPCEVIVDFDVVLDVTASELDADPGEWDPAGQSEACGEGGYCWFNGSTTDRHVFPVDRAAEVYLIAPDISNSGPYTVAQFGDYLDGTWWDPAVFWVEPSFPNPDPFGKPRSGQPYNLVLENGWVTQITQVYTP